MEFKVLKDGVTIQKVVGKRTSLSKTSNEQFDLRKSYVYRENEIVHDTDIAPDVLENYEKNIGNIRDLIEKIADEKTVAEKKAPVKTSIKSKKKSSGQKK